MMTRGHGKIVNTASLLSFQGGVNVPGYTSSKSAVAGLTKALANEWAPLGVNVNAVAPGYVATANTYDLRQDAARSQAILERIPAGAGPRPPTSPARSCSCARTLRTTSTASSFPSTADGWLDDR